MDKREPERPIESRREAAKPAPKPAPEVAEPGPEVLLGGEEASFRQEWESIQAGFVDEPRQAVEKADGLVSRAAQRLTDVFASERERLEDQWRRGKDVSTEDLRMALRRYRSFFDRRLSI